MTGPDPNIPPDAPPSRRFNWRNALLIGSLAVNLLFVGAAAARFLVHEPTGRMSGISEMQLIPPKFFGDLDTARRSEMMAVFRGYRADFREGREGRRALAAALADALAAAPYDETRVKQAIADFNARSAHLVNRGGDAALEFIGKLTDAERVMLSKRIRERVDGGRRDRDKKKD